MIVSDAVNSIEDKRVLSKAMKMQAWSSSIGAASLNARIGLSQPCQKVLECSTWGIDALKQA